MDYYGFCTRDYLILGQVAFNKKLSVLEIGIGTGSTARHIIGQVNKFCGVDISEELISWLSVTYKNSKNVSLYALDVCSSISLRQKFDLIYSLDTLEHVVSPLDYFYFISAHLADEGIGIVVFPNESEHKHHGVTRFRSKAVFSDLICSAGLKIESFYEIKKTLWHIFIESCLWKMPKMILSRDKNSPQTFEQTTSFKIIQSNHFRTKILASYAKIAVVLARMFPLYNFSKVSKNIDNKNLFVCLKRR